MCNGAHVRSITLMRLLNKRGVEALPCGVDKDFKDDTIEMLCGWAEIIFIQKDSLTKFEKRFGPAVNRVGTPYELAKWVEPAMAKMDTRFDVGYDDWKVPQAESLMMKMRGMVDAAEINAYTTAAQLLAPAVYPEKVKK